MNYEVRIYNGLDLNNVFYISCDKTALNALLDELLKGNEGCIIEAEQLQELIK